MQACLFNIQKFSLHDGPGIRTTVFFKGCPLRCFWCSNPESIAFGPRMLWNRERCAGCGLCANACPTGAAIAGAGIDQTRCTGCGACGAVCECGALTISGRLYGIDEVLRECLADRDFYEESGGGVTLSGGEVGGQADFAVALLRRLREEGIHTAIETNGCVAGEVFSRLAAEADLLLFDVKHHDPDKHSEGTGVDNRLILDNLAAALAAGREVLVRIPVIPGFSDSPEDARALGNLLAGMGVDRVQLLPFHQFGENKYASLGLRYALQGVKQLHKEDLESYRAAMREAGIREVVL